MRISHYCINEELMQYRFEDAKTLYEGFLRGKKVSGKHALRDSYHLTNLDIKAYKSANSAAVLLHIITQASFVCNS